MALRRAIGLATDVEREIRLVRRGMAIPAQSPVMPHLTGYDPAFKSEMSEYSPARAKALLELHGYVDRDGDGWREQPDGQPLVLQIATQPDQLSRQLNELRKKDLDAIGIRAEFKTAKWPENLKAGRSGKLQIWAPGLRRQRRRRPGHDHALLRPAGGQPEYRALPPAGAGRASTSA